MISKKILNPNSCHKHKAVQNSYPIMYAYDFARSLFLHLFVWSNVNSIPKWSIQLVDQLYTILYILWSCSYHYLEWYCDCFCSIRVFKYREIINWWTMLNVFTVDTNKGSIVTHLLSDPLRSFLTLSPFILLLSL